MEFDRGGIVPFLIASAAYLAYAFLPMLGMDRKSWKKAKDRLAAWRDFEVRIEAPDEATRSWVAGGAFSALTDPLIQQGFEHLGDYVLTAMTQIRSTVSSAPLPSPDAMAGGKQFRLLGLEVSRAFEHKEYGCIALATASREKGKTESQTNLQIVSSGDGWAYTSVVGEPSGVDVGQSARALSSYHEVTSVEQLIEAHLSRRAEVARMGGFSWGRAMTMEEIQNREENHAASVRDFARGHSPLSLLIWEYRMKRRVNREWLGELQGKL